MALTPRWRVQIVDMAGGARIPLAEAEVRSVAHELNAPGQCDVFVPWSDPNVGWISRLREVQVWRDGKLAKWGVIVRPSRDASGVTFQAPGLWWYMHRRVVGKAGRTNWLVNGNFESGALGPWTATGVATAVVTSHRTGGTYGLQLTQANPNVDTFVSQEVVDPPGGNFYTLDADLHIYSDYAYHGPAFEQRGLHVELVYPGGVVVSLANAAIDDSYEPGHTYHLETGIAVPADRPAGTILQVRLYAPGGRVMWDEVQLTLMESLSFPMVDQGVIANTLIQHAQDPAYGKSDLRIGTVAAPASWLRNEVYQHVDHAIIAEAIEAFAAMEGGFDFDVVPDALGQSRTFTMWRPRGVLRANLPLTLTGRAGDSCIGDGFAWDDDAESAVSTAIVQGDGQGPGRLEEAWVDTAATNGVVLEQVYAAPSGIGRDALRPIAQGAVVRSAKGLNVITLTARPGSGHLGVVEPGDTLPVHVRFRDVSFSDVMRVVRIVENPNGSVAYTVNVP